MPRNTKQSNEQALTPFAEKLSKLMDERGVSQAQVGEAIGAQRQTVSLYKLGQSKPDIESLAKIARFFGVTSDYLIGLSDENVPDLDVRAIVEKTGLSVPAVKVLQECHHSVESTPEDEVFPFSNVTLLANYLLTHPNFSKIQCHIERAQNCRWAALHKKDIRDRMTNEHKVRLLCIEEEALHYGSYLVDQEEEGLINEFYATKLINQAIAEMCAMPISDPSLEEIISTSPVLNEPKITDEFLDEIDRKYFGYSLDQEGTQNGPQE